jgi:hypothetical protein
MGTILNRNKCRKSETQQQIQLKLWKHCLGKKPMTVTETVSLTNVFLQREEGNRF